MVGGNVARIPAFLELQQEFEAKQPSSTTVTTSKAEAAISMMRAVQRGNRAACTGM